MGWIKTALGIVVVAAFLATVAGPLGPLPSAVLGGTEAAVPDEWSSIDLPDTIQLRTDGTIFPRVVNLWIVEDGNELYVFGANDSEWVKNLKESPSAGLRVGEQTFELRARSITPPDLTIYDKYVNRYAEDYPDITSGLPSHEEALVGGAMFKLGRI